MPLRCDLEDVQRWAGGEHRSPTAINLAADWLALREALAEAAEECAMCEGKLPDSCQHCAPWRALLAPATEEKK